MLLLIKLVPFVSQFTWLKPSINWSVNSVISFKNWDKIQLPEQIAERMDMTLDKVREILKIAQEPVSSETLIGEGR